MQCYATNLRLTHPSLLSSPALCYEALSIKIYLYSASIFFSLKNIFFKWDFTTSQELTWEVLPPPRGQLPKSGDIFDCHIGAETMVLASNE